MAVKRTLCYSIAKIGLRTDGWWFVNYTGEVPEQGSIEFKAGQLFFKDLAAALEFLTQQTLKHENEYRELVKKRMRKDEGKNEF